MPTYKRSRASSSSSRAVRPRTKNYSSSKKTTNPGRTWPYATPGWSMYADPFPAKARALLRYSTSISLDASAGVPAPYIFRAASIFDPDFTGVGHQPYGHDTYQSIYNHYLVDKATITLTPSTTSNAVYGISLTDDTTVQSDFDTIRETKGTKFKTMVAGGNPEAIIQTFDRLQAYKGSASDKPLSANFGASPSEDAYFHVWCEGSDSTTDPVAVKFIITISYYVTMWELKDLGQS